jgi:nicotinamidase-related amidase
MGTTAVIIIDVLNPYEHADAKLLQRAVEKTVGPLADLVRRAHDEPDVQLVYVNDNYGDFAASRDDIEARALKGHRPDLVEPVRPPHGCAFLPKVRHSAFYGTGLDYLLRSNDVTSVVLAGQVTEQCILYSALDAYVRHFDITVARDCVAHIHEDLAEAALRMMERNMSASLVRGQEVFSSGAAGSF